MQEGKIKLVYDPTEDRIKKRAADYRGFDVHGREYWFRKEQLQTELGCEAKDVEKIWRSGKRVAKAQANPDPKPDAPETTEAPEATTEAKTEQKTTKSAKTAKTTKTVRNEKKPRPRAIETKPRETLSPDAQKELEQRALAILKELSENGVPVTSTAIRNKGAFKSRGFVRRLMEKLAKDGKVTIAHKARANGAEAKQYTYELVEK